VTRLVKRVWIPVVGVVFASQDLNAGAGAGIEIVQFNPKIMICDVYGVRAQTFCLVKSA
jgi:hypothetical protein